MVGRVGVTPAGTAVGCRGARHRLDFRGAGLVQRGAAGDLLRLSPDAAGLADHERLIQPGGVLDSPPALQLPGAPHDTEKIDASPPTSASD